MKYDVRKNIAVIYGQGRRTYGLDACTAKPYVYMMALTGSTSTSFPGCSHFQSLIDCNMQHANTEEEGHPPCVSTLYLPDATRKFVFSFFFAG